MTGVSPSGVSSTNYNASYSRNLVVSSKLSKVGNKEEYVTEFFSINLIRLLRSMSLNSICRIGTTQITSQANKLYKNTTCYWMIAVINGFGSYLSVPSETIIGFPDITILNNLTNVSAGVNLNQSNVTI